jgi:two-component system chemotaxis response regulator CheB
MKLAVIAVSTGGPRTLGRLFREFPRLAAGIVLVQHMPRFIAQAVRRTLDNTTAMDVLLAEQGSELIEGRMLIAPGERHLKLARNRQAELSDGPKVNYVKPSADVTMLSLTAAGGDDLVAVVLTGLGADGANGAAHVKALGGTVLAQDRESSVIYGMPKAAVATGAVDRSLPPEEIRDWLIRWGGAPRTSRASGEALAGG